jgi:hypothetical protein
VFSTADFASMLVQSHSAGVRFGLGEIVSWNPDTFENIIQCDGINVPNLQLIGGTDALSYAPGQSLILLRFDTSGDAAFTQWIILGRLFTPGTDNAAALIDFLRGSLARAISAEIFVDRIHPAYDPAIAQRTSLDWGDPTNGADPGPTVTGVDIVTGSALIIVSVNIEFSTANDAASSNPRVGGAIGVEISGATSVAPDEETGVSAVSNKSRSGGAVTTVDGIVNATTATGVYLQTGLSPGLHDFTVKYRKFSSGSDYVNVDQRSITVIAF